MIDGCSSGERERGKVTDEGPTAGSRRQIDRPSALPSISLYSRSSAEEDALLTGVRTEQTSSPSRVT